MASSRTDMYARFVARQAKRKPPLPPGLRHYLSERPSLPAAQQVLHDGSVSPTGTGPFRRPRRGRTRPTPGSAYNAHRPRTN